MKINITYTPMRCNPDPTEKYQVKVVGRDNKAKSFRSKSRAILMIYGTAYQVSRILPIIRYIVKKMKGEDRSKALEQLEQDFFQWRGSKNAYHNAGI